MVADIEGELFFAEFREAFVDHEWLHGGPPLMIGLFQLLDDFGMGFKDVFLLRGVFRNVVELFVIHETPAVGADGTLGIDGRFPLSWIPATAVEEEGAIGPFSFGVFEEGKKRAAVDLLHVVWQFGSGEFSEGFVEIDVGGEGINIDTFAKDAFPLPEGRDVRATFVRGVFGAFQVGIEVLHLFTVEFSAEVGASVVGHEDDDGVFEGLPFGELFHHRAEVVVDVLHHAVATGGAFVVAEFGEALSVFLRSDHGCVRRIERDVGEEGLLSDVLLFHPSETGLKKEVSAIAFGLDDGFVVKKDVIEVAVFAVWRKVTEADLSNPACTVDEGFIESAIAG